LTPVPHVTAHDEPATTPSGSCSMVKIGHLDDSSLNIFYPQASPREGQSQQQKRKPKEKKEREKKISKDKKPKPKCLKYDSVLQMRFLPD